MQKKELLIIFILAVLVTGGSWFIARKPFIRDVVEVHRGLPFAYWISYIDVRHGAGEPFITWRIFTMLIDLLFWFLVLAGGWWVLTVVLKIRDKKREI